MPSRILSRILGLNCVFFPPRGYYLYNLLPYLFGLLLSSIYSFRFLLLMVLRLRPMFIYICLQARAVSNRFPHADAYWSLYSRRVLETILTKEKLLKMSNVSFCHNVFTSIQWFHLYRLSILCCPDVLTSICCRFFRCEHDMPAYTVYISILSTSMKRNQCNI